MPRLWVRVIKDHKKSRDITVPCTWNTVQDDLRDALHTLDIAAPMWLDKHEREFDNFRRTAFLPEHFVEDINFDRLEIEYLDEGSKKHRNRDPRNEF